jgi:hypothetical protein
MEQEVEIQVSIQLLQLAVGTGAGSPGLVAEVPEVLAGVLAGYAMTEQLPVEQLLRHQYKAIMGVQVPTGVV